MSPRATSILAAKVGGCQNSQLKVNFPLLGTPEELKDVLRLLYLALVCSTKTSEKYCLTKGFLGLNYLSPGHCLPCFYWNLGDHLLCQKRASFFLTFCHCSFVYGSLCLPQFPLFLPGESLPLVSPGLMPIINIIIFLKRKV